MAPNDAVAVLRSLELRLLRCTIPSDHKSQVQSPPSIPSTSSSDIYSLLNDVVSLIETGRHFEALNSPASGILFPNLQHDSPERFFNETVPGCVASFLSGTEQDSEELFGCKVLIVMSIGITALLAFTQCNFTGPPDNAPMPLMELMVHKGDLQSEMEWEAWSCKELMSLGSELCAKFSNIQYLIFAKTLLMTAKDLLFQGQFTKVDGIRSMPWWLFRILFMQQKLLVERSSLLFDMLQVFALESLAELGNHVKIRGYWLEVEDYSTIQSMLHLELGLFEFYYGRQDDSRRHFESAAEISMYDLSVSGALGFRTMHQVEPKALLRLVVGEKHGDTCLPVVHDSSTEDSSIQQPHATPEASDVYMTPRFIAEEGHSNGDYSQHNIVTSSSSQLTAVHQAVILAQCISVEKKGRNDELQGWEMAPYIEAIDSQTSTPFMLRCFCNLLRIRWESNRSRTKQRALLMMENLVEGILNTSPKVARRLHYCFGVNMPSIPALRKESADLMVSCGLIGEAMKIYEDLELWDNLIFCYKFEGKKAAAAELINKRISEKPADARLWCSLAEVTNNDTYYEKALAVSQNRSVRALRSLARSAYGRGEYNKSKDLWISAMSINSLYPDGWFGLGCAALKSKDLDKAIDAFTRTVQLDPEHGEAWNNIACIHLTKKRSKEAFIAFKEALKLKRDSWQMWENYGNVAADIGNFSQAIEAVQKVLDTSQKKKISFELLERIMLEIEGRAKNNLSQDNNTDDSTSFEADCGRNRETSHLTEALGRILKQVVQSGGNAETWGLYARWHKLREDLTMCSEALLKQVRSYGGSDVWKDKERFAKFARASLELCKVYQHLASSGNTGKELFAAERHLKSTIKQATVNFSDTEEFRDLESCLEDVQNALKAVS